ncbi:hypothetical protein ACFX2F_033608 [Malus domestica]
MPYGLKNVGATYQRLVNSMFTEQIGKSMEVYVDDMLVKSKHVDQHITNLSENFTILKKYQIRLNPNKCVFDIDSGNFLGFMISQQGIEANPEKIKAIFDMKERTTLKGSKKCITWTDECVEAFKNLKEYMSKKPHILQT